MRPSQGSDKALTGAGETLRGSMCVHLLPPGGQRQSEQEGLETVKAVLATPDRRNTYAVLVCKAMVTHSSTLAWKILWTEEPGGLQSMGSRRVGHD